MKIILKTVGKVFKQADTVREGTVSDLDLGDYLLEKGMISKMEYIESQEKANKSLKV